MGFWLIFSLCFSFDLGIKGVVLVDGNEGVENGIRLEVGSWFRE